MISLKQSIKLIDKVLKCYIFLVKYIDALDSESNN